ncbi:rRNA maturation RNase YbeY [Candidatus Nomurabacteria bacterium RIFCSPLOWO2_02_FULL_44_12]|uniref:Endoribonuclease YbeY n=1 Tax=Candidatus Nomurabacteria bacterium RIFCSPLOWO2_12_FULL_44_11 TaxID=1801796 RepID=A0A1F6Y709_9BACT|nr:MAG: rRNA maturation RNase YbeY [Candidatus Nomurabacteria bacterium RIFCSPHIGHO2_12_FULL_44_22b]OGJ02125.1 MAG: rRNA maturation RNase YbeY [Candidatus Nomurabacteria bacterium RIFCSPLOWO2_12_FULL_44_11]OGJ08671.1 MAG: rRNA maturation RNase YbeY [Candidatus Nomurabacteria bacterium RIFCSPLOWO2_02_FULL_44_12]
MYRKIKDDILGKKYSLSIAFVSSRKSRELNKQYRKKDRPTNVLAFPLRKHEGEIVLCRDIVQKEAKLFQKSYKQFLGFLVIHGMLHLKGMRHGSIMERAEKKYLKKYYEEHFDRHRRRLAYDQSRGGRILKRRAKS